MKVQKDSILSLKENIVYTSFEEGGIIFNLGDRRPYELNRTGILLLDLLDGKKDISALIKTFSLKCERPEDSVSNDVIEYLENLVERGWVYVR